MLCASESAIEGGTGRVAGRKPLAWLVVLLALLALTPAAAQVGAPDAGSLLRQIEKAPPKALPQQAQPLPATPEAKLPHAAGEVKVLIKGFRITGVTQAPADTLSERLAKYIGKSMTLAELEDALQTVINAYREQGFVVRAYLPPQTIKDGLIDIVVIEGRLGRVLIDKGPAGSRLSGERAEAYVRQNMPAEAVVKTEQLERNLLLLRDLAGTSVAATLEPGAHPGDIDVRLALTDTPLASGSLGVNNGGAVATGVVQADAQLNLNGVAGAGEQWSLRGLGASGLHYGRAALSLPLGAAGLSVGGNIAAMHYRLGDRFANLDASGSATIAGLSSLFPIVRSRAGNLYANASAEQRRYLNDSLGKRLSEKRVEALSMGVAGNRYDASGATNYGLTLTGGNLDLSALAPNQAADATSARTQGRYLKLSWNAMRLQNIGDAMAISAAMAGQVADKNLDSSEKFFLGGPNGVRAYPVNEAGGDDGWLLNLEARAMLRPELQAFVFADAGSVQQYRNTWPGWAGTATAPNRIDLAGAGVGLNWTVWDSIARLSVAWRIGNNPLAAPNGNDSDGSKRVPRIWAQYNKYF